MKPKSITQKSILRRFPLFVTGLLLLSVLGFLNIIGWSMYQLTEAELDRMLDSRLWSIGNTAALKLEEYGEDFWEGGLLPDALLDIIKEDLSDISERNELKRIFILDASGEFIASSRSTDLSGSVDAILEDDMDNVIKSAWEGNESATIYYQVEGIGYKRAYVPVFTGTGTVGAVLGIEAGAGYFGSLRSLKNQLLTLSLFSVALFLVILLIVYRLLRRSVNAEQSLHRTWRALELGRMTSSVAHELRNPMGIIRTNLEVILRESGGVNEVISDCLEEISRMESIIKRFLSLSSPDGAPKEKLSLQNIIKSGKKFWEHDCLAREVVLFIQDLPESEIIVSANRDSLNSVLQNIVSNALEATSKGGKISINILSDNDFGIIEISDTGKGMSGDTLVKAFDPFFSEKEGGTGIGLALCRRIMHEFGGDININSKPNKGTTVKLSIPIIGQ